MKSSVAPDRCLVYFMFHERVDISQAPGPAASDLGERCLFWFFHRTLGIIGLKQYNKEYLFSVFCFLQQFKIYNSQYM